MIETIELLSSPIGKEIIDGLKFILGPDMEMIVSIKRSAAATIISFPTREFAFRHWCEGVAGMSLRVDGDGERRSWARVGQDWVNL